MPDRRLTHFARHLRKTQTDAERRLWPLLRAQRLAGHTFRRQHPIAGYIADFYCHPAKLIVELDGGQHTEPAALAYDTRRTAAMNALGLHVLPFSDHDALKHPGAVARTILREVELRLATKQPPPRPSPGVPGEGEPLPTIPSPGTPGEG